MLLMMSYVLIMSQRNSDVDAPDRDSYDWIEFGITQKYA